MAASKRRTIEDVRQIFNRNGCRLISDVYINGKQPLDYICSCGSVEKITLDKFLLGRRCKNCGIKKGADSQRFTYEYVRGFFEKEGCELLEGSYINSGTLMKFRCSCGNLYQIRFNDFKRGHRCRKCAGNKRRGPRNGAWNSRLTSEDRIKRRFVPGYKEWARQVKERDNFTCRVCRARKVRLHSHHLEAWNSNKPLRLELSNGVTLCVTCHTRFHKMYGSGDNSKEQFDEFLMKYRREEVLV